MGRSKGRKKKKKYSNKKSITTKNNLGVTFKLQDNKLFFKTDRTDEEQQALNEQMLKAKPQIIEKINNNIERIIKIFSDYDRYILLGCLFVNSYFKQNDPSDDGKSERLLEYGHSFALAVDTSLSSRKPNRKIFDELLRLLDETIFSYHYLIMTESIEGNYTKEESHLRFVTISEALYMRGNGYMKHLQEVYFELFSGHDAFLKEKYLFTSKDLFESFIQFENSFYCRLLFPRKYKQYDLLEPHNASMDRFKEWQIEKNIHSFKADDKEPLYEFFRDNPDLSDDGKTPNTYNIFDIENYKELFKLRFRNNTQKLIAETLCCNFGDNTDFLNPKYKGLPLTDSIQTLTPIIKSENDYYLYGFNLFSRNLFELTESLIKKGDKNYYQNKYIGNKYSKSRDNFLESKVSSLFLKFIPQSETLLNLKYSFTDEKDNFINTELDLLVQTERCIYLVEMKAGGLSSPAKRGALKSLKSNLNDIVDYGSFQNLRALEYIKNSESPIFTKDNGETILVDKSKKIFRITITLEHLSGYLVNLNDLIAIGALNSSMAWTCSLFDLMIFSEIIENENDFIDYLEKRIPLYSEHRLTVNDEIDLLGYYLEHCKLIDESDLEDMDNFLLTKYSSKIDEFIDGNAQKPRKNCV